jgi:hypothetical protein
MTPHRPQKILCTWVRWMWACGLPRAHILFVLGIAEPPAPHIENCLRDPTKGKAKGKPPARPQPDRRGGRRPTITLLCRTVIKARRLAELGYKPATIAHILAVPEKDVVHHLRHGSRDLPPVVSPWYATIESDAWRYDRDASPAPNPELPAVAPSDAQRVAALDTGTETTEPPSVPPAPNPWEGSHSTHACGPIKLSLGQIQDAGELLRSGASYAATARHFGVSVNTLRRYVVDVEPRRRTAAAPPVICSCGCGRTVRKKGATSAHAGR